MIMMVRGHNILSAMLSLYIMLLNFTGTMAEYIGTDSDYRALPVERKIHPRGVPSTAADNAMPHKGTSKILAC